MTRHAELSRQCSNVMITTNALAVFFYTVGGPILRSMIHKNDHDTTARELPLKMEFPFDVYKSPVFEVVRIAQLLHDLSVACIVAMLNALIVTLVSVLAIYESFSMFTYVQLFFSIQISSTRCNKHYCE